MVRPKTSGRAIRAGISAPSRAAAANITANGRPIRNERSAPPNTCDVTAPVKKDDSISKTAKAPIFQMSYTPRRGSRLTAPWSD